jgi:hypothetical protein
MKRARSRTTATATATATAAYTRCTMEQIEDGNDAAPCPFNSVEFEDGSKLKIGLRKESNDEEVGQLPKIQNYHQYQYLRSEI